MKRRCQLFDSFFSRRSFLKATLACTLLIADIEPSWAKLPHMENLPEGKLSLYNTHSKERLTVEYRDPDGNYNPDALKSLNWILRCHFTGEVADMDIKAIDHLNLVDKKLGGGHEFHIISGYRSPEYNGLLRREGHHVAKHSLHMKAKAIDIAIPGVGLDKVHRTALNLRYGGVGYYPAAGFVHLDSGGFRTWG
jgi:uncharacterized protein YcbK (DUF882 family)